MSEGVAIRDLIEPPGHRMRRKKHNVIGIDAAGNGEMQFPEDLSTHFMALMFYRYDYTKGSARKAKLHRTILLPVPTNLNETFNIMYNESELGAIKGEMSDFLARGNTKAITDLVADPIGAASSAISGAMKAGGKGLSQVQRMFQSGGTQEAVNSLRGNEVLGGAAIGLGLRGGSGPMSAGLNRFFASAPNPHITALFKGVGLKTHNFTWKLAPRKLSETHSLTKIINLMRSSVLPERGEGNITLRFPDEVEIYIGGTDGMNAKDNKGGGHLYHFKRAVIRNLTTNFAPDGMPSFFAGTGAPTAVSLNIDLLETTIHTRGDYEAGYGNKGNGEKFVEKITGTLEKENIPTGLRHLNLDIQ